MLRRLARVEARLGCRRAELESELVAVRQRHARALGVLEQRVARLRGELEQWCREHDADLFPPGRRSLVLPFGEVGFRRARPGLRLKGRLTAPDVCRLLREAGLAQFVRVKESPDRTAAGRALSRGEVGADVLARCGLVVASGGDVFLCKVRGEVPVRVGGGQ